MAAAASPPPPATLPLLFSSQQHASRHCHCASVTSVATRNIQGASDSLLPSAAADVPSSSNKLPIASLALAPFRCVS